jgi:hypothetical protein
MPSSFGSFSCHLLATYILRFGSKNHLLSEAFLIAHVDVAVPVLLSYFLSFIYTHL